MKAPAAEPDATARPASAGGAAGYVRKLTRASNTNFLYAFLTLPKARREAIFAVYSFCHAVDDAVDAADGPEAARRALDDWRLELERVYRGGPESAVGVQLAVAVRRFDLPRRYLEEVVDGVAMDIEPRRFADWEELSGYCDLVAGAVGRVAVRIFGAADDRADRYAAALGLALQLTNILRDLGPDARIGRFYLPQSELAAYGLTEADVLAGGTEPRRIALLEQQAVRAHGYYGEAARLGRGSERTLFAAEIMGAIYRRLLDEVVDQRFPVAEPVVALPRPLKVRIALATWVRCQLGLASRMGG